MPLLPEELTFFRDNFETDFAHVMNKFDSKECLICFEEFGPDTRIVTFPRCQHLYHYNCLQEWLKKKKACALCKEDFRMNFATALKEKAEKSFLKRSPEFENLRENKKELEQRNNNVSVSNSQHIASRVGNDSVNVGDASIKQIKALDTDQRTENQSFNSKNLPYIMNEDGREDDNQFKLDSLPSSWPKKKS